MSKATAVKPRINIVTLGVKNLARSKQFYERVFGWTPSSASNEHIAFYSAGGAVLALFSREALAEDAMVSPGGTGFGGITLAHNVPGKEDVGQFLSKAEAGGAKILRPAEDAFWGGHRGYFTDPDGHIWEVAWNPHFALTDDGEIKLPA